MSFIKITAIFALSHLIIFTAVFFLQDMLVSTIVADMILAGTVYIPLYFWGAVGVNVTQSSGAMLPPPTLIGWFLCIFSWLSLYIVIGYVITKLYKKR